MNALLSVVNDAYCGRRWISSTIECGANLFAEIDPLFRARLADGNLSGLLARTGMAAKFSGINCKDALSWFIVVVS